MSTTTATTRIGVADEREDTDDWVVLSKREAGRKIDKM
jgi:hypothetical protein